MFCIFNIKNCLILYKTIFINIEESDMNWVKNRKGEGKKPHRKLKIQRPHPS